MARVADYYQSGDSCGRTSRLVARHAIALRWLGRGRDGRLLDIGCAQGMFCEAAGQLGWDVRGCDLNDTYLREARERGISVEKFDVTERWPYEAGYFAAVHASALLEHLFDYHAFLREVRRCLAPDGLLIVSVPNLAYIKCRLELLVGRMPSWLRHYEHIRGWTPRDLIREVTSQGFRYVRRAGAFQRGGALRTIIAKWLPDMAAEFVCQFSLDEAARR